MNCSEINKQPTPISLLYRQQYSASACFHQQPTFFLLPIHHTEEKVPLQLCSIGGFFIFFCAKILYRNANIILHLTEEKHPNHTSFIWLKVRSDPRLHIIDLFYGMKFRVGLSRLEISQVCIWSYRLF